MNKINIKILLSLSALTFIVLILLIVIYAKNNMQVYVPEKDVKTHLGILSGVANDSVDNTIYFSSELEEEYTISPDTYEYEITGPLQMYKLKNKTNPHDNNVVLGYFQRDNTTDIDIEVISLSPINIKEHQAKWFLDDF